jgi:hypothetical protein
LDSVGFPIPQNGRIAFDGTLKTASQIAFQTFHGNAFCFIITQ